MAGVRQIVVLFSGDTAPLKAAVGEADASLKGLSESSSKSSAIAKAGFAAGGLAVAAFGVLSVKAALEGEKSQATLNNAIKNTGASLKSVGPQYDELEAHGAKYGETNDQVRQGLTVLLNATGNTTKAASLLGITQDIAAAKHMDLAAAAKLVGKVSEGNVGSLGRFGLATKDATGKTITEAQAMQELQSRFHGVADEIANTPAGKLKEFEAQFHNLEETVGNLLLPILTKFIDGIVDLEQGFDHLSGPEKVAIESALALGAAGLVVYKAWGPITSLIGGVQTLVGKIGGSATAAAGETEGAAADADTALEETAATGEASATEISAAFGAAAADIVAAVGELTAAISSIGPAGVDAGGVAADGLQAIGAAATEQVAVTGGAFSEIGVEADALATQIQEAKAASDVGPWGGGGFAGGAGGGEEGGAPVVVPTGGSTADAAPSLLEDGAGAGLGLGVKAALGGGVALLAGGTALVATNDQAPGQQNNSAADQTFLGKSQAGQQKQIKQLQGFASETGVSAADEKSLEERISHLQSLADVTKSLGGTDNIVAGAVKNFGLATSVAQGFVNGLTSSVQTNTGAVRNNGTVTNAQASALKTYGSNLTGTLSPALSAIQAEQGLTTAKQNSAYATLAVAQAEKEYGKNSPQAIQARQAATQASQDQVTAAINENTALVTLAQTYQAGGKSVDDFKAMLQGLVSQGAITQDQANGMTLAFGITSKSLDGVSQTANDAAAALEKVPKQHAIGLSVDDKATGPITTVGGLVDALQGKRASVTIGADVSTAIANLDYLQSAIQAAARTDPSLYVALTGHTQSNKNVTFKAGGGYLQRGELSMVNEAGHEMFEDAHGRQYLMPGTDGKVIPNHELLPFGQQMAGVPAPTPVRPVAVPVSSAGFSVQIGEGAVQINVAPGADGAAAGQAAARAFIAGLKNLSPGDMRELGEVNKNSLISLGSKKWLDRVPS